MSTEMQTKVQASSAQNFAPVQTGLLQRQCALCNTPGLVEDSERDKEKLTLQRSSIDQAGTTTVPRFGHDLSRMSVHTDAEAARAYTVGQDVVFGAGQHKYNIAQLDKAHEVERVDQSPTLLERYDNKWVTREGRHFEHNFNRVKIEAHLLGNDTDEDPIHQPLIERYRQEHGLPVGGIDESGQQVGPSDAEIKYGGVTTRDASIFYVNFQNVSPPADPDHSLRHPGPNGIAARRAGYTRVRVRKRLSIPWDTGPAQSEGRIPLFARSVNVFYRLDPIEVFVSANYAVGSCPYRVTLEHERFHVRDFLRIFHAARESLIRNLERITVPTRNVPRFVQSTNIESDQNAIGEQLRQVILSHSASLVVQLEADRDSKDTPAAYATVYASCPASEW